LKANNARPIGAENCRPRAAESIFIKQEIGVEEGAKTPADERVPLFKKSSPNFQENKK